MRRTWTSLVQAMILCTLVGRLPGQGREAQTGPLHLSLRDGRKVPTTYTASPPLTRPLALTSADFDEDGMPDLVGGYATPGGAGAITLHRGNVDALWPYGNALRNGEPPAFLPDARVFPLPEAPDFLGAGDFDADGHWDIVTAHLGSKFLYLLRGDGHGGFAQAERIDLRGTVTALTTGEINRVDGLTDIAVGITGEDGAQVLVFESPAGALRGPPETFPLPAAATALAMLPLDDDHLNDLAVAAGDQLLAIHGRDRKLSQSKTVRDSVPAAAITHQTLPFAVRSLAAGHFTSTILDLAALGDDGRVHFLERADADYQAARSALPVSLATRSGLQGPARPGTRDAQSLPQKPAKAELVLRDEVGLSPSASRLVAAHISRTAADDVIAIDPAASRLHVVSRNTDGARRMHLAASLGAASGAPAAVLPMRLTPSALHGLVVLQQGQPEPFVLPQIAQNIFTVTNTLDPGAGAFNTENTSVPGSLRWAISMATDATGASTINFNIPVTDPNYNPNTGTFTITPLPNTNCSASLGVPCQGLPPLPAGCLLDAYTQPGGTLNNITQPPASPNTLVNGDNAVVKIVISGTAAGQGPDGIWLFNGTSTVRGLIVTAFNSALNPGGLTTSGGFGINAESGGNVIEGNFLGIDSTGTTAVPNYVGTGGFDGPNIIGGTTPQARNVLSGNIFANFGSAVDSTPNTYFVQGNYLGTDRTGTLAVGGGVGFDTSGIATVAGGTVAGAGNLLSGNASTSGVDIAFPAGNPFTPDSNIVLGNLIGTDLTGTLPLPNGSGVVVSNGNMNLIGGTTPAARNIVSGNNGDGFDVENGAELTTIQGNYIGVDISGVKKLANFNGINHTMVGNASNAVGTTIGGESAFAGNVISGNLFNGIQFGGAGSTSVIGSNGSLTPAATVLGNRIGTDATGSVAMANTSVGILITQGGSNHVIGGSDTPAANIIAFNGGAGVQIDPATNNPFTIPVGSNSVTGNVIFSNTGPGVAVKSGVNNAVSQNSIYSNQGLGIDVDATGPLVNSSCQSKTNGANTLQNAPVLTPASGAPSLVTATATDPNGNTSEFSNCAPMASTGNVLNIVGLLNSLPNTAYTIEFFQNAACDPSGFGQGKTFLNRIGVTTNASCVATFGDNVDVTKADLGVSLGFDPNKFSSFVDPNESFTYQATVINSGVASAASVMFTDTLPATETFVSATATQGSCNNSGNPLTCNLGTLASGATAHIAINVTITGVGPIPNTANVSSTTPDPNSANNSSTVNLSGVYDPAVIDHFSPPSDVAGTGALALTVFGFTFYPGITTVAVNNTTLPATFLANQSCGSVFQPQTCQALNVTIPVSLTAAPGNLTISVSNPTPGGNGGSPDSQTFIVYPNPGTVTQFQITGIPNPAVQNTPYNMTVTALDAGNHVVPGYRGIVNLTGLFQGSPTFSPSSPYQFTAADNGVHTFTATLLYTGAETISVTDAGTPNIAGTLNLTVNPLLGPPFHLSANATPDSIPIGFTFPSPLNVTVLDASGNLLPGISVTFTAIAGASGASGTFSNGQNSIQILTDTNGLAGTVLTANLTAGQFQVNATVGSLTAQWFPTSTANVPAHLTIVGGNPQSSPINTSFSGILDVMVTDAQNNPVKEVPVTFSAPTSGASVNLTSTTAVTAQFGAGFVVAGQARLDPIGVANAISGPYKVTASIGGLSVQFDFTNTPTPSTVASLNAIGTPQSASIHSQFSANLAVKPVDANGNCIAQVPVTFTAPGSGPSATLSAATALSDAVTCLAQVTATANGVVGNYSVTAMAPNGVFTTFALTNTAGVTTFTATAGTPQSALIGKPFGTALQATLLDKNGNPMVGQTVNFAAPTSGATATLSASSAVTSSSGVAQVTATANSTAGGYSVIATFGSLSASFSLTNAAYSKCDINVDGLVNIADVQAMINEVLGVNTPTNDLNQDGTVNVVDTQIVINTANGLGCTAK